MAPRLSVVVPTFNNAPFVSETVDSILAQTYADFELIIADHASQDGTWEILQRYATDPRVTLLQTEAGGGAQRNWNRVSEAACGEWLKLVCGDDLLYRSCLETQIAAVDESVADGPVVLVASPREVIDANGRRVVRSLGLAGLHGVVPGRTAIRRAVRRGTNIFGEPCATLLRREALENVGWWDGRQGYFIDEATYCKVLLQGDLVALPTTLSAFRLSSTQWSARLAKEQARQALLVHRAVQRAAPDLVGKTDVRIGNARARLRAAQRRILYFLLQRRL